MDKVNEMCFCVHNTYLPCPQQTTSCHQGSQRTVLEFLAVSQCNTICLCPLITFKKGLQIMLSSKLTKHFESS